MRSTLQAEDRDREGHGRGLGSVPHPLVIFIVLFLVAFQKL